jgi:hypothetical protein
MRYPTPTLTGHFWAKQKLTDTETESPSGDWEVVQVFYCDDNEVLRVFVPGFGSSESIENFFWGPEVLLPKELS